MFLDLEAGTGEEVSIFGRIRLSFESLKFSFSKNLDSSLFRKYRVGKK